MNAPAKILEDPREVAAREIREIRASLHKARDLALNFVATEPPSVTRDLNNAIATIANEFRLLDCPKAALKDALTLCRHLMRAQAISGQLDGTYPTNRYGEKQ